MHSSDMFNLNRRPNLSPAAYLESRLLKKYMGDAAIEAEFLDSQTNDVMSATVDKKMGNPIDPRFYRGFTTMGTLRPLSRSGQMNLRKH